MRPPPVAGRVAMVGSEAPVLAARPLGLGRVKGHDVAGVREQRAHAGARPRAQLVALEAALLLAALLALDLGERHEDMLARRLARPGPPS